MNRENTALWLRDAFHGHTIDKDIPLKDYFLRQADVVNSKCREKVIEALGMAQAHFVPNEVVDSTLILSMVERILRS